MIERRSIMNKEQLSQILQILQDRIRTTNDSTSLNSTYASCLYDTTDQGKAFSYCKVKDDEELENNEEQKERVDNIMNKYGLI